MPDTYQEIDGNTSGGGNPGGTGGSGSGRPNGGSTGNPDAGSTTIYVEAPSPDGGTTIPKTPPSGPVGDGGSVATPIDGGTRNGGTGSGVPKVDYLSVGDLKGWLFTNSLSEGWGKRHDSNKGDEIILIHRTRAIAKDARGNQIRIILEQMYGEISGDVIEERLLMDFQGKILIFERKSPDKSWDEIIKFGLPGQLDHDYSSEVQSQSIAHNSVGLDLGVVKQVFQHATGTGAFQADNANVAIVFGDSASNDLTAGQWGSHLYGYGGNDLLKGAAGHDMLDGGTGNDTLYGNDGDDTLYGGEGDDALYGGNGKDVIFGDAGNDTIYGGDGDDQLYGDAGNDTVIGGLGNDVIYGGDGDDLLAGEAGRDVIRGGNGNDTIWAGWDDDTLYGEDGNDAIFGEGGNDNVWAGSGDDIIDGGDGNDMLRGNAGNDRLTGGAGADMFIFDWDAPLNSATNVDTITDFTHGEDKLWLASNLFGAMGGPLGQAGGQITLTQGTSAVGSKAQLIYDRASGDLWYDADGQGGQNAVKFAHLSNHAELSASDFFLF